MLNRLLITLVAVVLTALASIITIGDASGEGRVLLAISGTHGIHTGDVPVLFAWLVSIGCCAAVFVRQP